MVQSCASCIIFLIHILLATLLHHKTFFEVTNWKAMLDAAVDYTLLLILFKSAPFFKLYVKVFQYLFSTLLGNGGFVLQEVLHLSPHTPERYLIITSSISSITTITFVFLCVSNFQRYHLMLELMLMPMLREGSRDQIG